MVVVAFVVVAFVSVVFNRLLVVAVRLLMVTSPENIATPEKRLAPVKTELFTVALVRY